MGKKEAIPNRRYTAEFKHEAVKLADAVGAGAATKRGAGFEPWELDTTTQAWQAEGSGRRQGRNQARCR